MATITKLVSDGVLFKVDPALGPDAQEFRTMYTSERLMRWMLDVLPSLGSNWNLEVMPAEQLDALLYTYASGDMLTYGWQFKSMSPVGDGIWEMKTADLRLFGWFVVKDLFVGVVADTKQRILDHRLYAGYRDTAVRFRDNLALDEPKFIPGDDPNDVVSNYSYP